MLKIVKRTDTGVFAETTEPGTYVFVPQRKRMKQFVFAYQDMLQTVSLDKTLNKQAFAILLYLMSKIEFDNYVTCSQKEVGLAFGYKATYISNTYKKLRLAGYLIPAGKLGQQKLYKLNLALCHKKSHDGKDKLIAGLILDKSIESTQVQ